MPMTDDEAREEIEWLLKGPLFLERKQALHHALQALADRQALVAAIVRLYECKSEVAGEPAIWWADNEAQRMTGEAYDAARRHMRGEE